jgi:hypothetical protein
MVDQGCERVHPAYLDKLPRRRKLDGEPHEDRHSNLSLRTQQMEILGQPHHNVDLK